MIKRLPLDIRRNYSTIDRGHAYVCQCDQCGQKFGVQKPAKGQQVSPSNLAPLMEHLFSHQDQTADEAPLKTYRVASYQDGELITQQLPMSAHDIQLKVVGIVGEGLIVDVEAANKKHAQVIAQGLFNHIRSVPKPHRHTWRDRFPTKE